MSEADRDALLLALLPDVPFDGWSRRALRDAAKRIGVSAAEAEALFPGGARDLIAAFSRWADRAMLERLEQRDLAAMKIHERVAAGVMTRLEILAPYREPVRRAFAILALPHNAPLAARLLYETVDAIWYAAGDEATDFNFYTKRTLLGGVYAATMLYWLEDRSPDAEATRDFLDRRLREIGRIPKWREHARAGLGWLPNPFRFAQTTRGR